jgi:hypothetical protein
MSNYSSGFNAVDSKLADRETSEREKKRKTILALMSVNEVSKVHLDAFPVNERPSTRSLFKINPKGNT